jgi:hypothetical protein
MIMITITKKKKPIEQEQGNQQEQGNGTIQSYFEDSLTKQKMLSELLVATVINETEQMPSRQQ